MTIDGADYCRDSAIYINPDSTSALELGSMTYPYKTIDQAFIEVFNHWDPSDPVDIAVLEGTSNNIYLEGRPLIANRHDDISLITYSTDGSTPEMATLNIITTETYATS